MKRWYHSALGYELVKSLQELRETLRALGSLADYLERNPSALLYGARRPSANGCFTLNIGP